MLRALCPPQFPALAQLFSPPPDPIIDTVCLAPSFGLQALNFAGARTDLAAALAAFKQEVAAIGDPRAPAVDALVVNHIGHFGGRVDITEALGNADDREWAQRGVWLAYLILRANNQALQRVNQLVAIARVVGSPATDEAAGIYASDQSVGAVHARAQLAALRTRIPPTGPWNPRVVLPARFPCMENFFPGIGAAAAPAAAVAAGAPVAEGLALCDLLGGLLQFNPDLRLTAEAALEHPFFKMGTHPVYDAQRVASLGHLQPVQFDEPTPDNVDARLRQQLAAFGALAQQEVAASEAAAAAAAAAAVGGAAANS